MIIFCILEFLAPNTIHLKHHLKRFFHACYFFPSQLSFLLFKLSLSLYWKDNDGQTPLHYAVVCEREAIAECLVKQNAGTDLKDNDGDSPSDLCKANWPWMRSVGKQIDWLFISLRLSCWSHFWQILSWCICLYINPLNFLPLPNILS